MNANLNKEQIDYIQSIVGITEYNYLETIELTEEQLNHKNISEESLEANNDYYWWNLIREKGDYIKTIDYSVEEYFLKTEIVYKIGERFFSLYDLEYVEHIKEIGYKDIAGSDFFDIIEVYPREITQIVYEYK